MSGPLTVRRWLRTLAVYFALFVAAMLISPLIGSEHVSASKAVRQLLSGQHEVLAHILFYQRVPRVILGLLAGGALAMAGAGFQVILRNPLAEPLTLGALGGAAVGAFLAMSVPALYVAVGPFSSVQIFSLAGAAAALSIVYRLARRPHGISTNTLLLAGITISILSGGVMLFIKYLANPYELFSMERWIMGGVDVVGYHQLGAMLPFLLPGLALIVSQCPALNQLALGEAMAAGHGVKVERVQRFIFIGGGLATAAVVSLTGPIGFVGLIVPHAVRRLSGFDQRVVLPASFLLGGATLALCDTVARTVFSPQELPVGVITAIVGGPLFIKILLGRRR